MKKLFTTFLILLLASSAIADWPYHNKPWLGVQIDESHPLSDFVGAWFFNEGSGNRVQDLSGNGNTGTLQADTHWVPGKFGSALDFDGVMDYVDLGSGISIGTGDFTFVTELVLDNHTGGNIRLIVDKDGKVHGLFILAQEGAKNILLHVENVGGTDYEAGTPNNSVTIDNAWRHIAITGRRSDASAAIYLEGVSQTLTEVNTLSGVTGSIDSGNNYRLGLGTSNNGDFDGRISYVMIYNRCLSASEIALLYREPFCMFEDSPVVKMFTYPADGVVVTPYYYRGLIPLPLLFFIIYRYKRSRKCAA